MPVLLFAYKSASTIKKFIFFLKITYCYCKQIMYQIFSPSNTNYKMTVSFIPVKSDSLKTAFPQKTSHRILFLYGFYFAFDKA